jgi:hypothetical protein
MIFELFLLGRYYQLLVFNSLKLDVFFSKYSKPLCKYILTDRAYNLYRHPKSLALLAFGPKQHPQSFRMDIYQQYQRLLVDCIESVFQH